ncbi:hypothetical protein [Streptomyces virginiae]|uniref:hypothetical protein n=1 Tax=Streptomyces virginiae TaxID=1961 RepID=UPI00224F4B75|nr:hypothetical protein [Streptomyces virginiae]MCX5278415.1 hypothetical protein [Streptomyces virginiae]
MTSDAERRAAAEAMERARAANTVAIWDCTVAAENLADTKQAVAALGAEADAHFARLHS